MTTNRAGSRCAPAMPSDAQKLHALIAANIEEGHLLPRTLDEMTRHADAVRRRRARAEDRRLRGAGAAQPAGRRSAIARRRRAARGQRRRRDARRRAAPRRAARRLREAVRVHARARLLHRMGFSIVPHLWLPEKIFTDCVKCPQFRRAASTRWSCRSTTRVASTARRVGAASMAARHAMTAGTTVADARDTSSGGVTTPRGFRAAGVSARHQGRTAASISRCSSPTQPATRSRRSSRPTARRRRRCSSRSEHLARSGGAARAIVVNSGCANACTGEDGLRGRARRWPRQTARARRLPREQVLVASTGVIGVALPIDEGPRGARRRRSAALGARSGRARPRARS